jgi:hypothetical protein
VIRTGGWRDLAPVSAERMTRRYWPIAERHTAETDASCGPLVDHRVERGGKRLASLESLAPSPGRASDRSDGSSRAREEGGDSVDRGRQLRCR